MPEKEVLKINQFLGRVIMGDCMEVLKTLPENSVDSIITDPPAGINFMGRDWDNKGDLFAFQDFIYQVFSEAIRVLKPGGYALVWAIPRTSHHTAMGIERAGFEIRDKVYFVFGSGFPKSLNIGKALDKKPEVLLTYEFKNWLGEQIDKCGKTKKQINDECGFTATSYRKTDGKDYWSSNFPTKTKWEIMKKVIGLSDKYDFIIRDNTEQRGFIEPTGNLHKGSGNSIKFSGKQLSNNQIEYKQWGGWGTSLKPAVEEWILARKPLSEKTVAKNVLKWGTGGINIDECRVFRNKDDKSGWSEAPGKASGFAPGDESKMDYSKPREQKDDNELGRFPANVILDKEAGKMLDEQSGKSKSRRGKVSNKGSIWGSKNDSIDVRGHNDSGGASRFFQHCPITKEDLEYNRIFYGSKASKRERNMGLDKLVIISIMKIWKENNIIKEEELAQLLMDTDILRKRDIEEFGIQNKKGLEWNTVLFGKDLMEKYQRDVVSIIGTEINSITPLKIWNWLNFLLTKEYTLDVKYEMENGGNPVANAENYKPLIITINEKMASRLGVKNVVEGTQLKISVKDGSNIHPTCKSLSLMRYLCRLITPPKGIVLDMFAGSGSTLIAAKQEGFNFIGIEKEKEYIEIAEARLRATPMPML